MSQYILAAEDNVADQVLLETAFRVKGYQEKLAFVTNGLEAIEFLENATHNLPLFILLDLNMPKKDGFQTLKELKEHAIFKNIPVNIFSITSSGHEITSCYEAGANSYIIKPNSFDDLLIVVEGMHNYWVHTSANG
jgi:CheY-like chemotaxis protein